jgi:hypothetical protein
MPSSMTSVTWRSGTSRYGWGASCFEVGAECVFTSDTFKSRINE